MDRTVLVKRLLRDFRSFAEPLFVTFFVAAAFLTLAFLTTKITSLDASTEKLLLLVWLYLESILVFSSIYLWLHAFGGHEQIFGLIDVDVDALITKEEPVPYWEYLSAVFPFVWDTIHFSVVTATTLGYGDVYPKSTLAKFFVDFHVLWSLSILVVGVGKYFNQKGGTKMSMAKNPVGWFEIYVDEMERAKTFYEAVLDVNLERMNDPTDSTIAMWSFPSDMKNNGVTGALVEADGFPASGNSTVVYFSCEDCSIEESRVETAGGRIQKSKMSVGEYKFITLAIDTEGNMFGLHSSK